MHNRCFCDGSSVSRTFCISKVPGQGVRSIVRLIGSWQIVRPLSIWRTCPLESRFAIRSAAWHPHKFMV